MPLYSYREIEDEDQGKIDAREQENVRRMKRKGSRKTWFRNTKQGDKEVEKK